MNIVGLYRSRIAGDVGGACFGGKKAAPAVYHTAQTTSGYSSIDNALKAFIIHGGKASRELAQFMKTFKPTDYLIGSNDKFPKIEIKGYWFQKDTGTLYAGVRTVQKETSKIYDVPLARITKNNDNKNTEILVQNFGNNVWEIKDRDEKYSLQLIEENLKQSQDSGTYILFTVPDHGENPMPLKLKLTA